MKLIADSGSTKTAWCLIDDEGNKQFCNTQGINPFQQSENDICRVMKFELLPYIIQILQQKGSQQKGILTRGISTGDSLEIYFYGAGCTPEAAPKVETAMRQLFRDAIIEVQSDMLGAARGLCGNQPGIVAILGTGSNSCYYNGTKIQKNVSPLGFILGDEGSGAYIGKRLVGDVLKRQLPDEICERFFEETHETAASIIQKTYREAFPNRFLASFSPFCALHRDDPAIRTLLLDCFRQFFIRNIASYEGTTVHIVGSVGYIFQEEIKTVAEMLGYTIGNVLKEPLKGLIDYHSL